MPKLIAVTACCFCPYSKSSYSGEVRTGTGCTHPDRPGGRYMSVDDGSVGRGNIHKNCPIHSAKEKAAIVLAACIKAYNMPYTEFLKQRGIEDGGYAREKYTLMQKNFAKYFCELDQEHSIKFLEE